MNNRITVLASITIIMLLAFYYLGTSIGYGSMGFAGSALALTCVTLLNAVRQTAIKPGSTRGAIGVHCTVGDK